MADVNEDVAEGADPALSEDQTITGWRRNIFSYPPIGTPDGGAHVTAADLATFLRVTQQSRLLSPAMTSYFLTPQAVHTRHQGWSKVYGPGLWFHVKDDGEVLFYEKEGENAGVSGMIRYYPAWDLSLVLLCNMQDAAWEPGRILHGIITKQGSCPQRLSDT